MGGDGVATTLNVGWQLLMLFVDLSEGGDNLEQTLEMIIVMEDKKRVYLIHEERIQVWAMSFLP